MSISITGISEIQAALSAVQAVVAAPFAGDAVAGLASEFAIQLEDLLRAAAPRRAEEGREGSFYTTPGEFAEGIEALSTNTGSTVTVEASAVDPLAEWIVAGTRGHPIDPVTKQMLKFPWHGEEVYRHHVNHPGTQPDPFEEEPANVVAAEMLAAYAEAVAQEVARAAAS